MQQIKIYQYQTAEGHIPFRKWLLNLKDKELRYRIRVRIDRLSLGNPGDTKPVGQGVFEIRISYGPGYRIYYGKEKTTVVLLLHGGSKKHQQKDILKAKKYWSDYLRRSHAT